MASSKPLQGVVLYDANANLIALADGDSAANKHGLGVLGRTAAGLGRYLLVEDSGKLVTSVSPPVAPPGTTEFSFAVDDAELDVGAGGDVTSPHTTVGPIVADGDEAYLQLFGAGTEGDSSENGSVVELYWRTSGPTDHLIDRVYVMGETVNITLPDVHKARDGTAFTGDGADTRFVVVRRRLSVAALEIDFILRGYTK